MTAPGHLVVPVNPWDAHPAAVIVENLERLAAVEHVIGTRDACLLYSAADRLRATLPTVADVATDDAPVLFEAPRHIPPGATFVIRRTDGVGFGMEEEFAWLDVDGPDDWKLAREVAEGEDEPVEFEMVMLIPTVLGKRTFGRGSLRGEGAA